MSDLKAFEDMNLTSSLTIPIVPFMAERKKKITINSVRYEDGVFKICRKKEKLTKEKG